MVGQLNKIRNKLFHEKERTLMKRAFKPKLFLEDEHYQSLTKKGYVIIEQKVIQDEVDAFLALYQKITEADGFKPLDSYFGSFSFADDKLWNFIHQNTQEILEAILPRIFDMNTTSNPLGGGFCTNPPQSKMGVYPHQDPTSVDESKAYNMTMWIALNDMTLDNGCLHVIPGSHLWGNIYRSTNIPWAFESYLDKLWDYLEPITIRKGDIICFDLSTIHASSPNLTNLPRLAVNVPILPKNVPYKVCSYEKGSFLNNKINIYNVDEDSFLEDCRLPSLEGKYPIAEKINLGDCHFSLKNIESLVNQYKSTL